jgi:metal-dependent HD superfamily phosphatase/phosphodiesterase
MSHLADWPPPSLTITAALHDLGRSVLSTAHTAVLAFTVLTRLTGRCQTEHRPIVLTTFAVMTTAKAVVLLLHAILSDTRGQQVRNS